MMATTEKPAMNFLPFELSGQAPAQQFGQHGLRKGQSLKFGGKPQHLPHFGADRT